MSIPAWPASALLAFALILGGCSPAGTTTATGPSSSEASAADDASAEAPGSAQTSEVVRVFDEVPPIHPSVDDYGPALVSLIAPDGRRWELPVLLADERPEQIHGLMEVENLPDGTGMLFTFDEDRDGDRGFWMSGTLIDLDIIYVAASGEPVASLTMVTCDETCPSYPPGATYRFTVEFPAGYLDRIGFDLQWRVEKIT